MSLDGLRAWIGEVERKLRMRTRVFLALSAIAVGGAGAAIYLAVDAQNNAVSESDVQALQQKLEARIDQVGGGVSGIAGQDVTKLEAEVKALKAQVEALQPGAATGKPGKTTGEPGAATGEPGKTTVEPGKTPSGPGQAQGKQGKTPEEQRAQGGSKK